jgi:uncharacterized protein YndB with AHSA1/START domain
MSMLKKILLGVLALIVVVVALGYVIPDKARAERSIVVAAPQEQVFAILSDLNNFNRWSPWYEKDPAAEYSVVGSGVGQKFTWKSAKREVGSGAQEIVKLEAPSLVACRLVFGEGMGVADTAFALAPADGGTKVTWSIESHMREAVPFYMAPIYAYMGFFMDQMMRPDFDRGLANLKRVAEQE